MEKSLTLPFESSAYFGYPYFPGQFGPYLYIPPVEPKAYEQIFVFQPTMPFFQFQKTNQGFPNLCQLESTMINKVKTIGLFEELPKRKDQKQQKVLKAQRSPQPSKPTQKQNRNVISNLLRHLFKSILEVRNYDELVEKIIARYKLPITVDAFNIWLYSHRINYKRYLRLSTVRFLFRSSKDPEMSLILRVLLTEFVRNYCISHFLTSKRMGKNSSKMHMTGARNLLEEMLE